MDISIMKSVVICILKGRHSKCQLHVFCGLFKMKNEYNKPHLFVDFTNLRFCLDNVLNSHTVNEIRPARIPFFTDSHNDYVIMIMSRC